MKTANLYLPIKTIKTFSLIVLAAMFVSCERVIDIDLNNSDPRYVIEAEVIADSNYASVLLTRSKNFSESNDFPIVNGAVVVISDNAGNTDTLLQNSDGRYTATTIRGEVGRTYSLAISVDGELFTSTSTIPPRAKFDSIRIVKQTFFGNVQRAVTPVYKDSLGIRNYYRFVQYKNGKKFSNILVANDDFNDGLVNARPLFNGDLKLEIGDTLKIEMQNIDKPVYDYYSSLSQVVGGGGSRSATPTNPISNIRGNSLGYFSARSNTKATTIIVE